MAATIYFSMGNADAVRLDRFHAMDLWIPSSFPCFDDWVELIHLFRHIALTVRAWVDVLGSFFIRGPVSIFGRAVGRGMRQVHAVVLTAYSGT
jgi:hypothetical protein